MKTIQTYHRAKTLAEAYELNQKKTSTILGGMMWLNMSGGRIGTAIDLCELGLNTITETEEEISIGAMTTLRQLETSPILAAYTGGAMAEAVKDIVGVQFRNMATLGGSLWGRFGFSDLLTLFLPLDSSVELFHGGILPLSEFAEKPYDRDILVRLILKKTPVKMAYSTVRTQKTDFPALNCSVALANGALRAAVGARPDRAVLVTLPQMPESAAAFGKMLAEAVPMGSNLRGSAAYRTHLAAVLGERCFARLTAPQREEV